MTAADPIASALPGVAADLEAQVREARSLASLRERDLNMAVRRTLGRQLGAPVVEIVVPVAGWPALGRSTTVTVVETQPGSRAPYLVAELKWIRTGGDYKIYEAMWDLFKMALQMRAPTVHGAYLITGAPSPAWQSDPCADLFSSCGSSQTLEPATSPIHPRAASTALPCRSHAIAEAVNADKSPGAIAL